MKFVEDGKGGFISRMEPSDASEERITSEIEGIERLVAALKKRGHGAEVRRKDRMTHYVSVAERVLDSIIGNAQIARRNIQLLDYPEPTHRGDPKGVQ
jgi:hypothetical protein